MKVTIAQLRELARLFRVHTSYLDMQNKPREASAESLLAILRGLGASISSLKDVPAAIREKRQDEWRQVTEPATVVWENEKLNINLRIPEALIKNSVTGDLALEKGERKQLNWRADQCCIINSAVLEGIRYVIIRLCLPEIVPTGYHKLHLETGGLSSDILIISSPLKAYSPQNLNEKIWGIFLPLYALHTRCNWGSGSYSDMEALAGWTSGLGGRMVGSLPLLASLFDRKYGPGPYLPASRFFWNEFYIDVTRVPEIEICPEAKNLIDSTDFQAELASLRNTRRVKYDRQMELKRRVMEKLTDCFFNAPTERQAKFHSFRKNHPHVEDYARFRAAGEKRGFCWHNWPDPMRTGTLEPGDYLEQNKQYHLYAQWICQEQIQDLSMKLKKDNSYLYLDLPVGVHPYGYDTWRYRSSFVQGINCGAPPDPVFTGGQNWGFPPLHPEKVRQQGYDYVIRSFQHQLKYAGMLRIDHMMGQHRIFCVPEGMETRDGVYISYPAEELYAILTLESIRNQVLIIGEDLGMVPPEVRPMMNKHGIYRVFVGQYQLITENRLGQIPSQSVASVNTHDMFPFTSFWDEKDISERIKLGLLNKTSAEREIEQRRNIKRALAGILQSRGLCSDISQNADNILKAVLKLLAESPTYALLINLEDLWSETRPQNVPGTLRTQNWSLKARYSWEEFSKSPRIIAVLQEIDRLRKKVQKYEHQ